jgi:hypothetical protein
MRQVITAPFDVELPGPVIYLGGPVLGADDWRKQAIQYLGEFAPEVHIASPRSQKFDGNSDRQLGWETTFLHRAALNGVLLWWLAKETLHRCNRCYAQAARFELGEWAARSHAGLARVVVGIERGFTGGSYVRRRLHLDYPNIPVCSTLRQTCAAAAELAQAPATTTAYAFLASMLRPGIGIPASGVPSLPDLLNPTGGEKDR